jgi:outer membrane cobalamin receptor
MALLCVLVFWSPCRASESVETDEESHGEEIVVFGTRLSTATPQSAEVISSDQLETRNAQTVAELLRQLPGITAIEPGGAGGTTELFLRGADPNFTTVFVDGVRMNDPTDARGGAFDFSTIATDEIESIEVVRGPYSALYGSGALAGAIYIDTRQPVPERVSGNLRMAAGTDDYWQAGAGVSGPLGAGGGGVNVNYVDFGEPTTGSGRTVANVSTNFSASLTDNLTSSVTLRISDRHRKTYPIAGGGPRLSVSDRLEIADANDLSVGASLSLNNGKKSHFVQVTLLQRDEATASPAVPDGVFSGLPASTTDAELDRYGFLLSSRVTVFQNLEIAGGVEYQHESGSVNGALDFGGFLVPTDFQAERRTTSPFVEGRLRATPDITVFAGLRYDDFSNVDSALSPRLGATWQRDQDGMAVTAAWGEARKAPSFYALGDPLVGNPSLEPEDSEGFDIRFDLPIRNSGLHLSLSGYRFEYTNLVDFDFVTFQLVNRTEVNTNGFEARLQGDVGDRVSWSLFAATSNNDVDGVENALLHRPERSAGGLVSVQPGSNWTIVTSATYEGRRPSSSIPGGAVSLDSYTRFNLALSRDLNDHLTLRIAVDNLFDTEFEAVAGFPAPGRQLRVGLQQTF